MTIDWEQYKVNVPEGTRVPWRIERFTVSEDSALSHNIRMLGYSLTGLPEMLDRRLVPGDYTRLIDLRKDPPNFVMMSDTPAEIAEHLMAIRMIELTENKVLINGLGLGLVVQAALRCKAVQHVDVVEIDPDIITLVGPHYEAMANGRLTIHHADALEQRKAWPKGSWWTTIWHDIWPTIDPDDLSEHTTLLRSYGRRCVWQGAWFHSQLQVIKRREQALLSK